MDLWSDEDAPDHWEDELDAKQKVQVTTKSVDTKQKVQVITKTVDTKPPVEITITVTVKTPEEIKREVEAVEIGLILDLVGDHNDNKISLFPPKKNR